MFGFLSFTKNGSEAEEEQEEETEPITNRQMELKIRECNDMITQVNNQGWEVYKLPDDASVGQVKIIDEDLSNLYQKVSENRPQDHEERKKIVNARQAVMELLDMYKVYDYSEVKNR